MPRAKATKINEESTAVETKEIPSVEAAEPTDPGVTEKKTRSTKAAKKTAEKDKTTVVTVIPDRLNIRKRPDVNSPVLTVVDKGSRLEVTDFDSSREWSEIVTGGYAMTRFLRA